MNGGGLRVWKFWFGNIFHISQMFEFFSAQIVFWGLGNRFYGFHSAILILWTLSLAQNNSFICIPNYFFFKSGGRIRNSLMHIYTIFPIESMVILDGVFNRAFFMEEGMAQTAIPHSSVFLELCDCVEIWRASRPRFPTPIILVFISPDNLETWVFLVPQYFRLFDDCNILQKDKYCFSVQCVDRLFYDCNPSQRLLVIAFLSIFVITFLTAHFQYNCFSLFNYSCTHVCVCMCAVCCVESTKTPTADIGPALLTRLPDWPR